MNGPFQSVYPVLQSAHEKWKGFFATVAKFFYRQRQSHLEKHERANATPYDRWQEFVTVSLPQFDFHTTPVSLLATEAKRLFPHAAIASKAYAEWQLFLDVWLNDDTNRRNYQAINLLHSGAARVHVESLSMGQLFESRIGMEVLRKMHRSRFSVLHEPERPPIAATKPRTLGVSEDAWTQDVTRAVDDVYKAFVARLNAEERFISDEQTSASIQTLLEHVIRDRQNIAASDCIAAAPLEWFETLRDVMRARWLEVQTHVMDYKELAKYHLAISNRQNDPGNPTGIRVVCTKRLDAELDEARPIAFRKFNELLVRKVWLKQALARIGDWTRYCRGRPELKEQFERWKARGDEIETEFKDTDAELKETNEAVTHWRKDLYEAAIHLAALDFLVGGLEILMGLKDNASHRVAREERIRNEKEEQFANPDTYRVPHVLQLKVLDRETAWCRESAGDIKKKDKVQALSLFAELEADMTTCMPRDSRFHFVPVAVSGLPAAVAESPVPATAHSGAVSNLVRPVLRKIESRNFSYYMDKCRTLREVSEWNGATLPTLTRYLTVYRDTLDCLTSLELGEDAASLGE